MVEIYCQPMKDDVTLSGRQVEYLYRMSIKKGGKNTSVSKSLFSAAGG